MQAVEERESENEVRRIKYGEMPKLKPPYVAYTRCVTRSGWRRPNTREANWPMHGRCLQGLDRCAFVGHLQTIGSRWQSNRSGRIVSW